MNTRCSRTPFYASSYYSFTDEPAVLGSIRDQGKPVFLLFASRREDEFAGDKFSTMTL